MHICFLKHYGQIVQEEGDVTFMHGGRSSQDGLHEKYSLYTVLIHYQIPLNYLIAKRHMLLTISGVSRLTRFSSYFLRITTGRRFENKDDNTAWLHLFSTLFTLLFILEITIPRVSIFSVRFEFHII